MGGAVADQCDFLHQQAEWTTYLCQSGPARFPVDGSDALVAGSHGPYEDNLLQMPGPSNR